MQNSIKEIAVTVLLIAIAILLLNPFHFWMPDMMVMVILLLALVLFGMFASFILRERASDEREGLHRTLAGRNAFLIGAATLTVGIVVQGYSHSIDPWLVIALVLMIATKLVTRMWSDRYL